MSTYTDEKRKELLVKDLEAIRASTLPQATKIRFANLMGGLYHTTNMIFAARAYTDSGVLGPFVDNITPVLNVDLSTSAVSEDIERRKKQQKE